MFTAQFVRIYRTFSSYIPHILIMFTAHFVRIYRTFTTFWQADSGGTRGRIAPAGPIKNNFAGGGGGGGCSDRRAVISEGTGWV